MTSQEMDKMIRDAQRATLHHSVIAIAEIVTDTERAIFLAGMGAAADIAEQSWKDGYRGDANSGFKYAILRVANRLSIEAEI